LIPMTRRERTLENAQKLRLILARALVKEESGQPLTGKEEQLLAELYRRRYERRREHSYFDSNGVLHIKKTIDAEPIMEAMKAYGDFIDSHSQRKVSQRIVGSLDPFTALNWSKECGAKVGTKEFAQFAMKRLKNDSDYRRFRVGN